MRGRRWVGLAALLVAAGCGGSTTGGDADAGEDPTDAGDAGPPPPTPIPLPEPPPSPDPPPQPDPDPEVPYLCPSGARAGDGGRQLRTMLHDDLLRSVYLHVPERYEPTVGATLVLNIHGFSSADWQQALLTGMGAEAEARGVVVAYPQGVASSWNAGDCCGTAWLDAVDDVGFLEALIDRLSAEYCIDPRRIYATGMSNGGFMSHRLACELSDRIAAIAPVAGVLGVDDCSPARSVPVFAFHGTEDALVPYEGGTPVAPDLGASFAFRSVAETMEHWRVHNGCEADNETFLVRGDTTCVSWTDCAVQTQLCTVEGGGHTWPGGLAFPALGHTTDAIDATAMMLDFFERHPMPWSERPGS